ncbi:DUF6624 domain-containing protein [Undibacterium terreum]|nr:DUF6624 domain-containing protein [Undibacterium terreum]
MALLLISYGPLHAADSFATIRDELIAMGKQDQAVRINFNMDDPKMREAMGETDRYNRKRLNEIIEEIGWPTTAKVGMDASLGAFFIAQHAMDDRPLMDLAFTNIEAEFKAGKFPGKLYAMMYDRLKMFDGLPQKYGTQAQFIGSSCDIYKLEDPAKVEIYRTEVGLTENLPTYKAKMCGNR